MLLAPLLEVVALVGGTVHPMVPGESPREATVLIRDGRIEAVLAAGTEIPAGARRVDCRGMHVVPGLIDGMMNFDAEHDALFVSQGVTLVRDMGSSPPLTLIERDPAMRDHTPGPEVLFCGAVIDGDPPSSSEALILRTPEQAEADLTTLFEGYDPAFVSIQRVLPAAVWERVVERAHARDLAVWGPVPAELSLRAAVEGGQDGIVFLDGLLPQGTRWAFVQPPALRPAIDLLAGAGTALVPLLHATALRTADQGEEGTRFERLHPLYERWWGGELEFRRSLLADETWVRVGGRVAAKQAELVAALHAAGVPLLPGSGSPHPWLMPGEALHAELGRWQDAGIPPADLLRLVTRGAAEILGRADQRGSIAPGLIADLVVVRDDPTLDIAALRSPRVVVVRGRVLERRDLDDLLETLVRTQDRVREDLAKPLEVAPPRVPEGVVVLSGTCEVLTLGQRLRAERYSVVREPSGSIAYCGRVTYPQEGSGPTPELEVLQRTRDGRLVEFEITQRLGENVLTARGIATANQMRIERRLNGMALSTRPTREKLTCVDVGSVTTYLILAQLDRDRPFVVCAFHEELEPELAQWAQRLGVGSQGRLEHQVRTHKGLVTFRTTDKGSIEIARNVIGGGIIETLLRDEDAFGGAGLPLPPAKVERARREAAAASAAEAGAEPEEERGGAAGDGGR